MVAERHIENGFIDSRYRCCCASCVTYVVDEGEREAGISRENIGWESSIVGDRYRFITACQRCGHVLVSGGVWVVVDTTSRFFAVDSQVVACAARSSHVVFEDGRAGVS